MTPYPTVEDLRLVDAVARHGSLGAAARELLVSQPSASQRLAALERRVGVSLFDRDTTGARPTAAGQEFCEQAAHVLDHLGAIVERTLSAAQSRTVSVGTLPSFAGTLFAALDVLLDDVVVQPEVEHGPRLLEWVERGTLDAAFVTIAKQVPIARGLVVTEVGRHDLVTLLPDGAPAPGSGRRPYTGQTVVYCPLDLSGRRPAPAAHRARRARAARRDGGSGGPDRAGAALRRRRARHGGPLVCRAWRPDGARADPRPGDLSMVTRSPAPSTLVDVLPGLRERLRAGNVHAAP